MKYAIIILFIFMGFISLSSCTQQNSDNGERVIDSTPESAQNTGGGNTLELSVKDYSAGALILNDFGSMQQISSPYILKGKAPRSWFFEGSFPVTLSTLDDEIIVQTYATGDWLAPVGDNNDLNGQDMIEFSSNIVFEISDKLIGDAKIQFIHEDMSGENGREITEALVRLSK